MFTLIVFAIFNAVFALPLTVNPTDKHAAPLSELDNARTHWALGASRPLPYLATGVASPIMHSQSASYVQPWSYVQQQPVSVWKPLNYYQGAAVAAATHIQSVSPPIQSISTPVHAISTPVHTVSSSPAIAVQSVAHPPLVSSTTYTKPVLSYSQQLVQKPAYTIAQQIVHRPIVQEQTVVVRKPVIAEIVQYVHKPVVTEYQQVVKQPLHNQHIVLKPTYTATQSEIQQAPLKLNSELYHTVVQPETHLVQLPTEHVQPMTTEIVQVPTVSHQTETVNTLHVPSVASGWTTSHGGLGSWGSGLGSWGSGLGSWGYGQGYGLGSWGSGQGYGLGSWGSGLSSWGSGLGSWGSGLSSWGSGQGYGLGLGLGQGYGQGYGTSFLTEYGCKAGECKPGKDADQPSSSFFNNPPIPPFSYPNWQQTMYPSFSDSSSQGKKPENEDEKDDLAKIIASNLMENPKFRSMLPKAIQDARSMNAHDDTSSSNLGSRDAASTPDVSKVKDSINKLSMEEKMAVYNEMKNHMSSSTAVPAAAQENRTDKPSDNKPSVSGN